MIRSLWISVPSLTLKNASRSRGDEATHPTRSPGANTLEKVPRKMTSGSSDFKIGGGSPSYVRSPYGSSSTMTSARDRPPDRLRVVRAEDAQGVHEGLLLGEHEIPRIDKDARRQVDPLLRAVG